MFLASPCSTITCNPTPPTTPVVLGVYEFGYLEKSRVVQRRLSAALLEAGSAHRQLEKSMAESEANLNARLQAEQEYSKRQADLTAMVSHEVRTPVNAISGAALLLSQTDLNTDQQMLVELLGAGVKNITQLVADVLEFAVVDKGNFPVKNEAVNISRLTNAVSLMVRPRPASRPVVRSIFLPAGPIRCRRRAELCHFCFR